MTTAINSTTATTTPSYAPTFAKTASVAALTSQAVSLSAQSAVVASFGGASSATVYSAAGLLNTLQQAGVSDTASTDTTGTTSTDAGSTDAADTAASSQQALDQGIVSTLSSSTTGSGVYTGAGASGGMSAQASANWADLLKTNPGLSSTLISSSYNLGIVSSLSVTA